MILKKHYLINSVAVVAILFLTLFEYAQARVYDCGIEITDESFLPSFERTTHGYVQYQLRIVNHSPKTHVISLNKLGSGGYGEHVIRELARTVTIAPQGEMTVDLMLPPISGGYDNLVSVTIDGIAQDNGVFIMHQEHGLVDGYYSSGEKFRATVLMSKQVKGDLGTLMNDYLQKISEKKKHYSHGAKNNQVDFKKGERPIHLWGHQWLGYSRVDGIMLATKEIGGAPRSVYDAIANYVSCGGLLVLVGEGAFPFENITTVSSQEAYEVASLGLGQLIRINETDVTQWSNGLFKFLDNAFQKSKNPFAKIKKVEAANKQFSVIENLDIPVKGMFTLILIFSFVMGPLNLFTISKKGKRMRLFWTVPLLSIMATCSIAVYAICAEGLGGHVRSCTFTLLDQQSHRASTFGILGYYFPMTPGEGLRFDVATEITPQLAKTGYRDSGKSLEVDWTNGQHLKAGWISSRVPTHLQYRRSQMRRERIELKQSPQGLTLINGLGGQLADIYVMDFDGNLYHNKDVTAGATVTLTPLDQSVPKTLSITNDLYLKDWFKLSSNLEKPFAFLKPGTYVVKMIGNAPFIEVGIDDVVDQNLESYVYGIFEREIK